jgi:hypothetical protein
LDLLRRLADAGDAEARLKHLQHGFDLHHGRLEPDALAAGAAGSICFDGKN